VTAVGTAATEFANANPAVLLVMQVAASAIFVPAFMVLVAVVVVASLATEGIRSQ